jgi:hypothetical protein
MKLFFSLLLLINTSFASTPYILVSFHKKDMVLANRIKRIFKERFLIPREMYNFKQIEKNCNKELPSKAAHICLTDNKIKFLYRDQKVLDDTLGVFWK